MKHLLILSLLLLSSLAWTVPSTSRSRAVKATALFSEKENVESISLASLTDHEAEGALLATSVARWLDAEWMPQDIHVQMGLSAKKSYMICREEGDGEIMSIMMRIASDLEADWSMYDKDAFVNAWDVANYVSDYLTKKSGSEGCECSSQIY
jgi:hypothetical protein